jgi:hypothetical protein
MTPLDVGVSSHAIYGKLRCLIIEMIQSEFEVLVRVLLNPVVDKNDNWFVYTKALSLPSESSLSANAGDITLE